LHHSNSWFAIIFVIVSVIILISFHQNKYTKLLFGYCSLYIFSRHLPYAHPVNLWFYIQMDLFHFLTGSHKRWLNPVSLVFFGLVVFCHFCLLLVLFVIVIDVRLAGKFFWSRLMVGWEDFLHKDQIKNNMFDRFCTLMLLVISAY